MVSEVTFQNRINYLVAEQGIERQASFYGVTRRTITRWQRGETSPSASTRNSVRRRGLTAGAPVSEQVRVRGRFTTPARGVFTGNTNFVIARNRQLRRERNALIRDARARGNPAQVRAAQAMPTRMTRVEQISSTDERTRLVRGGQIQNLINDGIGPDSSEGTRVLGSVPDDYDSWMDYYDDIDYDDDDWADWRRRNGY